MRVLFSVSLDARTCRVNITSHVSYLIINNCEFSKPHYPSIFTLIVDHVLYNYCSQWWRSITALIFTSDLGWYVGPTFDTAVCLCKWHMKWAGVGTSNNVMLLSRQEETHCGWFLHSMSQSAGLSHCCLSLPSLSWNPHAGTLSKCHALHWVWTCCWFICDHASKDHPFGSTVHTS